MSAYK